MLVHTFRVLGANKLVSFFEMLHHCRGHYLRKKFRLTDFNTGVIPELRIPVCRGAVQENMATRSANAGDGVPSAFCIRNKPTFMFVGNVFLLDSCVEPISKLLGGIDRL